MPKYDTQQCPSCGAFVLVPLTRAEVSQDEIERISFLSKLTVPPWMARQLRILFALIGGMLALGLLQLLLINADLISEFVRVRR